MSDRYVVDPSALMQAYIKDTYTTEIKHLLSQFGSGISLKLDLLSVVMCCGSTSWC